jgi:hypothetical protein
MAEDAVESAGAKAPAITISTQKITVERAQMRLLSVRGKASYQKSRRQERNCLRRRHDGDTTSRRLMQARSRRATESDPSLRVHRAVMALTKEG